MNIEFFVAGKPEALARPRAVRMGPNVRVYQPRATWQGLVALRAQEVARERALDSLSGPARLKLEFRMPRTKSLPKRTERPHVSKPDLSNVCKSTEDGLVPALLADDRAVVLLVASKRYALAGETPGCQVTIEEERG